jgi:HNH endonuclease
MAKKIVDKVLRDIVFERANYHCEYCHVPLNFSPQPFVLEHIMPLSKGGQTILDNLACSCGGCNGHKYNKTEATDPVDLKPTPLFNPRIHAWTAHFRWSEDLLYIVGISDIGRATEAALYMNRAGLINIRSLLLIVGMHPPVGIN